MAFFLVAIFVLGLPLFLEWKWANRLHDRDSSILPWGPTKIQTLFGNEEEQQDDKNDLPVK